MEGCRMGAGLGFFLAADYMAVYTPSLETRKLVPPRGIEPLANGLGNRCSIRLSYGGAMGYGFPALAGASV